MLILNNMSLKQKITAIILSTSCIVLLVSFALLASIQLVTSQRLIVQELETISRIVADNVTAAVVFDDKVSAEETLSALRAKPNILSAYLQRSDGSVFAQYHAEASNHDSALAAGGGGDRLAVPAMDEAAIPKGHDLHLLDGFVDLYTPIVLDGETIGRVFIRSDLESLYAIVQRFVISTGLSVLILIIIAFFIASRLQEVISKPILNLLSTMRAVSADQNYALRAEPRGSDELGVLIDNFNAMLARIETHDAGLRAAWREAKAASHAKTEFLAKMSHELRTPLNAIIGFSEVIKGEIFGPLGAPRYHDYVEDIHQSGSHLLDVINDILDISRVEAGQLELSEEPVNILSVIEDSLRLVTADAQEAGLEVSRDLDTDLPDLHADARMVKQSVINLLSNAVKFTPRDGRIVVRAGREPDGALVISVSDNGIGIAEEDIPGVMAPFGQVEGAFTRSHQGSGLGLPLTKAFVEAHGGSLEIESALDSGTEATIRFPAERLLPRQDIPEGQGARPADGPADGEEAAVEAKETVHALQRRASQFTP